MDLIQNLIAWLYWYFRPAIKWFLRQTTRLCELQRICYGETPGAQRSCAVGKFQRITFLKIIMSFRVQTQDCLKPIWQQKFEYSSQNKTAECVLLKNLLSNKQAWRRLRHCRKNWTFLLFLNMNIIPSM